MRMRMGGERRRTGGQKKVDGRGDQRKRDWEGTHVDTLRKEGRKDQTLAEPPAPADPLPPGPLLSSLRVMGCQYFVAPRF
jgi:hypothetical protein